MNEGLFHKISNNKTLSHSQNQKNRAIKLQVLCYNDKENLCYQKEPIT